MSAHKWGLALRDSHFWRWGQPVGTPFMGGTFPPESSVVDHLQPAIDQQVADGFRQVIGGLRSAFLDGSPRPMWGTECSP